MWTESSTKDAVKLAKNLLQFHSYRGFFGMPYRCLCVSLSVTETTTTGRHFGLTSKQLGQFPLGLLQLYTVIRT